MRSSNLNNIEPAQKEKKAIALDIIQRTIVYFGDELEKLESKGVFDSLWSQYEFKSLLAELKERMRKQTLGFHR